MISLPSLRVLYVKLPNNATFLSSAITSWDFERFGFPNAGDAVEDVNKTLRAAVCARPRHYLVQFGIIEVQRYIGAVSGSEVHGRVPDWSGPSAAFAPFQAGVFIHISCCLSAVAALRTPAEYSPRMSPADDLMDGFGDSGRANPIPTGPMTCRARRGDKLCFYRHRRTPVRQAARLLSRRQPRVAREEVFVRIRSQSSK